MRGQCIASGAQAVTIQGGTDKTTITKGECSRAIPGFDLPGMVFTPGTPGAFQLGIVLPGRGNEHLHAVQQVTARKREQFQDIVQLGRVTSSWLNDWQEIVESAAPMRREQRRFACLHPVAIALDGIYLAIVCQQPQGLSQRPRGKGVGAIALVKDGEGARIARVGQIEIEARQLIWSQQPLVDNCATRKRGYIGIIDTCLLPALLNQAPGVVKASLILLYGHETYFRESLLENLATLKIVSRRAVL